ncbi:hypothetical protein [Telmatospirillum sp.]|uniref:hypothetical protein n=1 Tax=Telmatospirillum sp. TaxID=2079197 RepID=UPI00284323D6|nr:hypothetical protein [Telmatospirillum sp.]MDR3440540.1 hypothetical protein [Telmatospirillum sp.]
MKNSCFAVIAVLGVIAMPALAQTTAEAEPNTAPEAGVAAHTGRLHHQSAKASNISSSDTRSVIAPNLPTPSIGWDGSSLDYLKSARTSLAAGHTGQAQQSLEMAETRALDRSVPQDQTNARSDDKLVLQVASALQALGNGQRQEALKIIDAALAP